MATVSEVLRARLAALPAGGAVEVMVWFDPARPRDQVGAELARVVGVVRDVVPSVPALVSTATAAQVDVLARLDFVGRIDLYEADGEDD